MVYHWRLVPKHVSCIWNLRFQTAVYKILYVYTFLLFALLSIPLHSQLAMNLSVTHKTKRLC